MVTNIRFTTVESISGSTGRHFNMDWILDDVIERITVT